MKNLFKLIAVISLVGCGDKEPVASQNSTVNPASEVVSVLDFKSKEAIESPKDIEIRIAAIQRMEPKTDSNTREGEAEYIAYRKLKKEFEESLEGKEITNWTCTYNGTPKDLIAGLGNINSMEFLESKFECNGIPIDMSDVAKTSGASNASVRSGAVGFAAQNYEITIKEDNARLAQKLYANDKIKFSGEIKSCTIFWISSKVNFHCFVDGWMAITQ